jgi:acyl carrier protein
MEKKILPLGRGIKDVQLLVLSTSQQLAGIGEVGEIYFRSPHLAKGYMGDDALTQERFVINPFTKTTNDRLYKTGDVARYLPDGNIEFLGRTDDQVKIRGFRIELGEIEAVLGQHHAVRETVVLAREDIPGERRLIAYIVLKQRPVPTATELRSFLKEKMPDYMVPSAFVWLEELPLTPNGKVDRRALPAPDQSRPDLKESFVAPRTPAEEVIAGIWAEVLKLEQVGVHDNFFDLGGHSLLATQVMSRVREAFRMEMPLRTLFEAPTVAQLGESVAAAIQWEANRRFYDRATTEHEQGQV